MTKKILLLLARVAGAVVLVVATIMLVRAFDSRRKPDLKPWHRAKLENEFAASMATEDFTLADYFELEHRLFAEVDEKVGFETAATGQGRPWNRYDRRSPSHAGRLATNWNRSQRMKPVGEAKGAALLLHGLSDSPYSMRRIAEILYERGFDVLVLRVPGHGTVPASLMQVHWQDMVAAVRVAARSLREEVGVKKPFVLGGYSNGGTLAVNYSLEAIESGDRERIPDRMYLFSPAIGVTAFARVAGWHRVLSFLSYFEKFKWQDLLPEYDPYKYNSFPKLAGHLTFVLAKAVDAYTARMHGDGKLSDFPPTITFQSVVDSTVKPDALVTRLYERLEPGSSEIVLFDVNREAGVRSFLKGDNDELLEQLAKKEELPFAVTVVTNESAESGELVARTRPTGSNGFGADVPLGLRWPLNVYSLSHVAIPFAPDDPVYGRGEPGDKRSEVSRIGTLTPRGEKNVLSVPVELMMRIRYNPFFSYLERRLGESLDDLEAEAAAGG